MLGKINLAQFKEAELEGESKVAWEAIKELVGASYKPIAYVGNQPVKGVNHYYIAEQTIMDAGYDRRLVMVAVNEFNGQYAPVPSSFEVLVA